MWHTNYLFYISPVIIFHAFSPPAASALLPPCFHGCFRTQRRPSDGYANPLIYL